MKIKKILITAFLSTILILTIIYHLIKEPKTNPIDAQGTLSTPAQLKSVSKQTIQSFTLTKSIQPISQPINRDIAEDVKNEKIPLAKIPGGDLLLGFVPLKPHIYGAHGMSEILADSDMSEGSKVMHLANIALNQAEEDEVRQEALDQWLRYLSEDEDNLLIALAKDNRLSAGMIAILIKDTLTRPASLQKEVALLLLNHPNEIIKKLAHEQLEDLN